jgi:hypothetical protein
LILPKPIVGKIIRGEITHLLRPGSTRSPGLNQRYHVKAGQSDPIACHIFIREIRVRRLEEIDYDVARKLGYRTTDEFKVAWVVSQDGPWVERWEKTVRRTPEGQTVDSLDDAALLRFLTRHLDRRVFLVRFEVDRTEHPRLLADRNARTDYVESPAMALAHEPEAVDERTQDRFSAEGHQGWVAREGQRELDRELLSAEERMRLVRIDARAMGVDIGDLERSILQRVRAAERLVHKRKAA